MEPTAEFNRIKWRYISSSSAGMQISWWTYRTESKDLEVFEDFKFFSVCIVADQEVLKQQLMTSGLLIYIWSKACKCQNIPQSTSTLFYEKVLCKSMFPLRKLYFTNRSVTGVQLPHDAFNAHCLYKETFLHSLRLTIWHFNIVLNIICATFVFKTNNIHTLISSCCVSCSSL